MPAVVFPLLPAWPADGPQSLHPSGGAASTGGTIVAHSLSAALSLLLSWWLSVAKSCPEAARLLSTDYPHEPRHTAV
jgi:hypothetical protein